MNSFDELDLIRPADSAGFYGRYGGRYVAETLMSPLQELAQAFDNSCGDRAFQQEFNTLLRDYSGRPTPLTHAERLTKFCGGAQIYLKREDLGHTGSHKINNALGQALLARRMGKLRILAETGAGQHGVAAATVCARFGMECVVYMGAVDVARQELNVYRMKLLGAEVRSVTSGTQTLKDAINEAMRDWVKSVRDSYYLLGSALGPDPYPRMVRFFQSVIGEEARRQILEAAQQLPAAVVACVGGGSNAIGIFSGFQQDSAVRLIGVEAGGRGNALGDHAARFTAGSGRPGVLHGALTYVLQNSEGQIADTHSVSAGLDYCAIGPEHAHLQETGRAEYASCSDAGALDAFHKLSELEGIVPALESSHAVSYAMELAGTLPPSQSIVINLSGRGDKDVDSVRKLEAQ